MMFIEMAAYIGDVLSYYVDSQFKESILAYAEEKRTIYNIAQSIGYKTKVSSEEISKDGVLSYLSAIGSTNNYYSDNNVAPHMFNVVQEIGLVESIWKMEDLYESKEEMDRSVLMLVHGEQTMNFSRMLKFGEKIDSYALICLLYTSPSPRD